MSCDNKALVSAGRAHISRPKRPKDGLTQAVCDIRAGALGNDVEHGGMNIVLSACPEPRRPNPVRGILVSPCCATAGPSVSLHTSRDAWRAAASAS
jgi:hypothetical protein